MKSKTIYSAIFTFILSLALTSCAFLQKEEFAKKKYYNFPLTKHSVEKETAETAATSFAKTTTEKISAVKENPIVSEKTIIASSRSSAVAEKRTPEKTENKIFHAAKYNTEIKNEPAPVALKKVNALKAILKTKTTPLSPASNGDAMLIIELLLAIILPPLAVFIHKGRIDKWFWITLLLCLFGGGLIWGPAYVGGGAFLWIVAAVIAICYVFGIIKK
jgi:uncharacterized membrane protein YqaE (UPF0057 family)